MINISNCRGRCFGWTPERGTAMIEIPLTWFELLSLTLTMILIFVTWITSRNTKK